ncbi:MAG: hypothetical protein ACI9OD_005042 [Limisphaerales bacterium]|jgi:hypothetical protein
MNFERIISIGSLLAAATFVGLWQHEKALVTPPATDNSSRAIAATAAAERTRYADELTDMNERLVKTTDVLRRISAALQESRVRVLDLEFGGLGQQILAEDKARELSGIHSRTNVIAKVIAPDGRVHVENGSFSSKSGGRLFFKTTAGPKGFHIDELHPVILRGLGFEPNKLRADDTLLGEKKAVLRKLNAEAVARAVIDGTIRLQEKEAAERQNEIALARLAVEREQQNQQNQIMQQQVDEQRRRAIANEQLQAARIDAERVRAASEYLLLQQHIRNRQQQQPVVIQTNPRQTQASTL